MKPLHLFIAASIVFLQVAHVAAESSQQKLYILNGTSNDMTVVDVASNQIIKTIEVGSHPHGIAAPKSQDILYVSAEHENELVVVDTIKDVVLKKYKLEGKSPNEIEITSDGRFVYIPAMASGYYEVFDTLEEKTIAKIPTDGGPHNVVIAPDGKYVYLCPADRGNMPIERVRKRGMPMSFNEKIYVVDTSTHKTIDTIPTGDAPRPTTISPDGKRLYVNTDGLQGFIVVDIEQRKQIARVEYPLTEEEKALPSRSHGITVTPDGKQVWASDVNHGLVFVYDVTQNPPVQLARLDNGAQVYWMTATPDGKTVYVASPHADTVTAYDVATRTKKAVIQIEKGKGPKRILVVDVPKR